MGYTEAVSSLGYALISAFPHSNVVRKAVSAAGFAAMGADVLFARRLQRLKELENQQNIYLKQAELYRREANKLASLGSQTSKYLAEEGASPDTDCFSCATAHLAGMEGALRRAAREAEKEGHCGPSCQKWVHIAAQEPAALFARDWTKEKYEKLPPEQRRIIEKYAPAVEEQMKKIAPTPEGEGILRAAALLKESIRFAEAGDNINHPEVEWRRLQAEAELSAAERLNPGTLPAEISQDLRRLRRDVGSNITSVEKLIDAAKRADSLSLTVNSQSWRELSPKDLEAIADNISHIRVSFAADRRGENILAHIYSPTSSNERPHGIPEHIIKEYTVPGVSTTKEATKEQIKEMFDNVVKRLEERGIKVVYRDEITREHDVPPGSIPPGGVIEAFYDPRRNTITLGASKMAKDSYSIQSLMHEATHALLHNPACHPVISKKPYDEMPEEGEADLATLAAMLELGIPVEDRRGVTKKPSEIRVDWERIKSRTGPDEENIRWASQWLVRAARGEDGGLISEKCPALRR